MTTPIHPTTYTNPADETKARETFFAMLRKCDTAMMVTHGSESGLHARPMAIAGIDADGALWFITGQDTPKIDELVQDATILAVMQEGAKMVTVGGRAKLSRDRAKVKDLWKESFRAWFKGKDDPNIALIRIEPLEGEYWDNSGLAGVKYTLKLTKAVLTNQQLDRNRDDKDLDVHGKVRLS